MDFVLIYESNFVLVLKPQPAPIDMGLFLR